MDSTPLRVKGLSRVDTQNVNVSFYRSQHTPRDLCAGNASWLRSKSLMSFALSSLGKACITSIEFDTTLCRRRLAVASAACVLRTRSITSLVEGFEIIPSST